MKTISSNAIASLCETFIDDPSLTAICQAYHEHRQTNQHTGLIDHYHQAIAYLEDRFCSDEPDNTLIELYQKLFLELESQLTARENSLRHDFIVIIPVADRPKHLYNCLNTLLELCKRYHYGGSNNQTYTKITALIADDSKQLENINENRKTAEYFTQQGLCTHYFGQHEQLKAIGGLNKTTRNALSNVIGEVDHNAFYHKGASLMRNITYLNLLELTKTKEKVLFYFVDSDQEFKIRFDNGLSVRSLYGINYFYYLDQIFSTTDTQVLTGKVVGDPPVSPAVMAVNFLEDVIAFLIRMTKVEPNQTCQFHAEFKDKPDEAAYHDMADLFGFSPTVNGFHYHCPLCGEHGHTASFSHFSVQLERFFDGEHPTRRTSYEATKITTDTKPARTVYTGNYIFKPEALRFFIPFAPLKLRMAGPVLGRLIKSEINDRFVSANLPMLHQRTVVETGEAEFRPGIYRRMECIDLTDEYERQFFGDVMLFSMDKLIALGYPKESLSLDSIQETVRSIDKNLHGKYTEKHQQIIHKLQTLKTLLSDQTSWWNSIPELEASVNNFRLFINNVEHNFGDGAKGFELISNEIHRDQRLNQIVNAIAEYPVDSQSWHSLVCKHVE